MSFITMEQLRSFYSSKVVFSNEDLLEFFSGTLRCNLKQLMIVAYFYVTTFSTSDISVTSVGTMK